MSTAITIITPADLQSAGGVLSQNQTWLDKYEKKHNDLLKEVEQCANGKLTPELDERINSYLVSNKQAVKKMSEDRKPYTSKAQDFVKLFTVIENKLEKELYDKLQSARDKSAGIYAKEEKEKQEKERKKLLADQERITLKAEAEAQVRTAYQTILNTDKGDLLTAYETCDAETIDAVEEILRECNPVFKIDKWNDIKPVLTSKHGVDLENVILNAKIGKYEAVAAHYAKDVKKYADYLLSLIPTRREEIKQGAESAAAAELKIQQAADLKKQQDDSTLKAEQATQAALQQATSSVKIAQFKRQDEAPKTRTIDSYVINVLNRDGWAKIFEFYFERSEVEDLGKVKLESMKTWCERYAKSNKEFIEHEAIEYVEKFKAVASSKTKKVTV